MNTEATTPERWPEPGVDLHFRIVADPPAVDRSGCQDPDFEAAWGPEIRQGDEG